MNFDLELSGMESRTIPPVNTVDTVVNHGW